MSRGPKAVPLDLSEQEHGEIQRLLRRHGTGQALVSRLRIILACAEPGATNLGVATALKVSRQTVASGGVASPRVGWRGWSMLPGLVRPAASTTKRSSVSSPSLWRRLLAKPRTGAPARWRSARA
jgi:hypothetical protein